MVIGGAYLDSKNSKLLSGKLLDMKSLCLPETIEHIAYGNGFFAFVTYDKSDKIQILEYWVADGIVNNLVAQYAQANFELNNYQYVAIRSKVIDMQIVENELFVLTKNDSGNLLIQKHTLHSGHFGNATLLELQGVKKNIDTSNTRIIVANAEKGNLLLIYGLSDNLVYSARFNKGQALINLERINTLMSHFHDNSDFIFTIKEHRTNESFIEFWGVEKNSRTLFRYLHSLDSLCQSELHIKTINTYISSDIQWLDISAILFLKVKTLQLDPSKENFINNDVLILSIKNYNMIKIIPIMPKEEFILQDLTFMHSVLDDDKSKANLGKSKDKNKHITTNSIELGINCFENCFDILCKFSNKIVIAGNSRISFWKVLELPIVVNDIDIVKKMNTRNRNLYDS